MTDAAPRPSRWRALAAGTAAVVVGIWAVVFAIVSAPDDAADSGTASFLSLLLGIAMLPVALWLVARLSGRARPALVTVQAFGLALVSVPVTFLAGEPVTGLVAGIGFGGAHALELGEHHSRRTRWWAAALATGYAWVLVHTIIGLALLVVPLLPLTALGVADVVRERRAARAGEPPARR